LPRHHRRRAAVRRRQRPADRDRAFDRGRVAAGAAFPDGAIGECRPGEAEEEPQDEKSIGQRSHLAVAVDVEQRFEVREMTRDGSGVTARAVGVDGAAGERRPAEPEEET